MSDTQQLPPIRLKIDRYEEHMRVFLEKRLLATDKTKVSDGDDVS